MYSKIMMLLWERWRRTRWVVIGFCLLLLTELISYVPEYSSLDNGLKNLLYLAGFIIFLTVLLVGQCKARNLDLAFPQRLFRFPVNTTTLFTIYMGYGIVALALPFLLFYGIGNLIYSQVPFPLTPFLLLETVYIAIQTLSWLGGPARFLYVAISIIFIYISYKILAIFNQYIGNNILYVIIIIFCCGISFWSVLQYRHGAWLNSWQWGTSFLDIFRNRISKDFSSPLQAQIWFELRRTGPIFQVVMLCFMSPFLGRAIFYLVKGLPPSAQLSIMVQPLFWLTLPASWLAGMLVFAVYHHDKSSGASIFWLRRPMETRTLALARLYITLRSVIQAIAIFLVFALALTAHDLVTGALDISAISTVLAQGSLNLFKFIGRVAFVIFGLSAICWTIFRQPIAAIITFLVYVIIFVIIGKESPAWSYIGNALILLPVFVIGSFIVALRKNLISKFDLLIAVIVFPVVVISFWAIFHWSGSGQNIGFVNLSQWQLIRLLSAATLPFIPVVVTPLIMDRLRHR